MKFAVQVISLDSEQARLRATTRVTTVDHSDIRGLITAGRVSVWGFLGLRSGVQLGEELCHKGVCSRVPRTAFFVSLVIETVCSFRGAGAHGVKRSTRMRMNSRRRIVEGPGEAESGSAGTQPDEEYPGLRCANSASAPWWQSLPGGISFSRWTSEPMP